jgi:hypothetical protein
MGDLEVARRADVALASVVAPARAGSGWGNAWHGQQKGVLVCDAVDGRPMKPRILSARFIST